MSFNKFFYCIKNKTFFTGSAVKDIKSPRIADSPVHDEQLASETSLSSNLERQVDVASGNQTEISTSKGHQSQSSRKRKISGSSHDPGTELFPCYCPLN